MNIQELSKKVSVEEKSKKEIKSGSTVRIEKGNWCDIINAIADSAKSSKLKKALSKAHDLAAEEEDK